MGKSEKDLLLPNNSGHRAVQSQDYRSVQSQDYRSVQSQDSRPVQSQDSRPLQSQDSRPVQSQDSESIQSSSNYLNESFSEESMDGILRRWDSITSMGSVQTCVTMLEDSVSRLSLRRESKRRSSSDEKRPTGTGDNGFNPPNKPSRYPFRMENLGEKSLKYVKKRLPILSWAKTYNLEKLISDCIAGITVGLTVIPQGIAYAVVAGLDPQYGLYSAFMGCFVYCVFGSSKDITIGPTAIMALMTQIHAQYGPDFAVLLSFLSGFIILAFGLLQLGFLIDFISVPVIAGFTSAAAITIACGQVKSLLGISVGEKSHLHFGIVDGWIDVFKYIHTVRYQDALLGLLCCIILLLLRALDKTSWFKTSNVPTSAPQRLFNKLSEKLQRIVSSFIWFTCTSRNAIVVVLTAMIAGFVDPGCIDIMEAQKQGNYSGTDSCIWDLTGSIQEGLPPFRPPPFSTMEGNTTVAFSEMIQQLGSAVIVIPLIAILESVAIAKAFASGKPIDASQEMIALGLCNIFGSFVSSMPTTGSFSRTAVNAASGVKSQFAGVFTGGLVILCLAVLIPYCALIPKATLAAVIITAVIFSVEHHLIKPMWRSKKIDLLPALVCFLVCLLYELEIGILAGVSVQLFIVLYHIARPKIEVEKRKVEGCQKEYLYISPDQGILFPSVTYVRNLINKSGYRQAGPNIPVVIDCSNMNQTDYTAAEGFRDMVKDINARQTEVYWLDPPPSVTQTLQPVLLNSFKTIYGDIELGLGAGVGPTPPPAYSTADK